MCLCSGYKGEREFLLAPAVYGPEIRANRCICRHLHLINHDIHLSRELNVVHQRQHIINYITERQCKSRQRTRQDLTRRRTRRRKASCICQHPPMTPLKSSPVSSFCQWTRRKNGTFWPCTFYPHVAYPNIFK